jgi:hypothetical protein
MGQSTMDVARYGINVQQFVYYVRILYSIVKLVSVTLCQLIILE